MKKNLIIAMLFVFTAMFSNICCAQSEENYVPSWKVGQRWVLEASYRDLRLEGNNWMPAMQWIFHVRAIKNFGGEDCYVLHVYGRKSSQQNQAVLWLSVDGLKPLRVIDVYPTAEGMKYQERDINQNSSEPLVADGTPIPYDLPSFPLKKASNRAQSADGFGAYRGASNVEAKKFSRIRSFGGISFKRSVSQKSKAPEKQFADTFAGYSKNTRNAGQRFQVEIDEDRSDNKLTQLWQQGMPWAVSSMTRDRKVRLVPESELMPNNGGENR